MSAGFAADALCLVTDRRRLVAALGTDPASACDHLRQQVGAAVAHGVGAIQVREPDLVTRDLLALVADLRAIVAGRATLLVNERADVAAAAGAGLHLKESSMPAARLRAWLPVGTPIWRAVHDVAGVVAAGPVDAVLAGTAAATVSKAPGAAVLGPDGLAAIVRAATRPVYAIGGLTGADAAWLRTAGVAGCAGIGVFLPRAGESIEGAVGRAVRDFRQER